MCMTSYITEWTGPPAPAPMLTVYSCLLCAGLRFYLPLDDLNTAVSAGMAYSPVTRADLANGFPAPGWNVPSKEQTCQKGADSGCRTQ
jgi:hypothetical protein